MSYRAMRVADVRRLTPNMTRISFHGEDLRGFTSAGPDAYIKLFFPLPGQDGPELPPPPADEVTSWYRTYLAMPDEVRPPMRTYTIRACRSEQAQIDVDFAVHGDSGPATRWASTAAPGDRVAFLGSHALYSAPPETRWQLLIGDETALPAIGGIVESLAPGQRLRAYVEIDGPADEQRFETRGDVDIRWVHRGSRPHGEPVLDALRAADFPAGSPYAWISGEAAMVKVARRHLVRERGVDKRSITFTGYWRKGVSEEEVGRQSIRELDAK